MKYNKYSMLRFIFLFLHCKQMVSSKMSWCDGSAEVSSGGVNVLQGGQVGSNDFLQASLFAAACSCPGLEADPNQTAADVQSCAKLDQQQEGCWGFTSKHRPGEIMMQEQMGLL